MAKKIDSELKFRCNATQKAKAKYLCKKKYGKTISQILREHLQDILYATEGTLSRNQRKDMLQKIS